MSFHNFMEMALYYPRLGYYTSEKEKIGVKGDYYTSSEVSSLFGSTIASQIEEMWLIMGKKPFTIVEYGAGNGNLCRDILDSLKVNKRLYDNLRYCIIEKGARLWEKGPESLANKVSWHNSIKEINDLQGCILSNELLDNYAVHRVVMKEELMEIYVDDKNGFVEVLRPATTEIKDYLKELQIELPENYCTEVNLEAIEWIKEIAAHLKRGYILTIDYGYPSSELYAERRRNGTMLCYHKHEMNDQPYNYIGEQDITSHVNFSALHYWGLKNGLTTCGFTNQAQFLLSLGFNGPNNSKNKNAPINHDLLRREAFLKYTLLVDMGNIFKILIQSKGTPDKALSGLKHAPYAITA